MLIIGKPYRKAVMCTIKIPVKPHLKKFAVKHYDANNEIIIANKHTTLGIAIESILRNRYQVSITKIETYSDHLTLELNQDSSNLELRIRRLAYLNYILDKEFKKIMFVWVTAHVQNFIPAHTAVKSFLKFYQISESEYGSDSAYRQWLRMSNHEYKRKSVKKQSFSS